MKRFGRWFWQLWQLLVLVIIFIGALFYALFQGNAVSWTIFYAQLPFTLYALLVYLYPLSMMTVERHIDRQRLQDGDTVQVTVIVRKKIPFPHFYLVLLDRWTQEGAEKPYQEMKKLYLFTVKREIKWQYTLSQMPRGEFEASMVQVEVADIVNWVQRTRSMKAFTKITVFPKTVPLTAEWALITEAEGQQGHPLPALQDVLSIASVRAYEHGDRLSWVHWKSFAKTEELMTKEFDHQGTIQGILLFDPRTTNHLEARITMAASMIARAQRERLLLRYCHLEDPATMYSVTTKQDVEKILMSFARTTALPNRSMQMDSIMTGKRRDETFILVTALIDWEMMHTLLHTQARHSLLVYLVLGQEDLTEEMHQEIAQGRKKGVIIQPIIGERIIQVAKGVKASCV